METLPPDPSSSSGDRTLSLLELAAGRLALRTKTVRIDQRLGPHKLLLEVPLVSIRHAKLEDLGKQSSLVVVRVEIAHVFVGTQLDSQTSLTSEITLRLPVSPDQVEHAYAFLDGLWSHIRDQSISPEYESKSEERTLPAQIARFFGYKERKSLSAVAEAYGYIAPTAPTKPTPDVQTPLHELLFEPTPSQVEEPEEPQHGDFWRPVIGIPRVEDEPDVIIFADLAHLDHFLMAPR